MSHIRVVIEIFELISNIVQGYSSTRSSIGVGVEGFGFLPSGYLVCSLKWVSDVEVSYIYHFGVKYYLGMGVLSSFQVVCWRVEMFAN
jgi:hypothetical protein